MLGDVWAYLLAKAIPGAIGLASVTVLVRVAGVEEYGRYSLLLAIVTFGGVLSSTWLSQSVLRMTAADGLSSVELNRLRWRHGPSSFGPLAALFGVGLLVSGTANFRAAAWGGAFLIAFHLYAVELAVLQAGLKSLRFAAIEVTRAGMALVFPLLLALWMVPASEGLLAGSVFAYAAAWALLIWLRAAGPSRAASAGRSMSVSRLLSFGVPLSVWAGASQGLSVIDRFAVAHFLGDAAVGGYSAIYDVVVRGFAMLLFPVTMAVHPRLMHHALAGRDQDVRRILRNAVLAHCLVGSMVIPIGFAFRGFLSEAVLGLPSDKFASLVLPLLCGAFLWQAALLLHKPIEIANGTRYMLGGMLVSVGVAICSNYLLVQAVGLVGAAISTVLSALTYIGFILVAQLFRHSRHGSFNSCDKQNVRPRL